MTYVEATNKNEETHRQRLLASHLTLQKAVIWVGVPLSLLAFIVQYFNDRCWQHLTILIGFSIASVIWIIAPVFTKRGNINASVGYIAGAMIGYQMLTMLVFADGAATALLGDLTIVIYAALFSRRLLYWSAAGTFVSFAIREFIYFLQLFEPKVFEPTHRLIYQVGFSCLLLAIIVVVLRRSHIISKQLVDETDQLNNRQSRIIQTAGEVGQALDQVIGQIKETASVFAVQASEQAAAINQMNRTMSMVREISHKTSFTAKETNDLVETGKKSSRVSRQQFGTMEKGLGEVIEVNKVARVEFDELALQAESIEDILVSNREIAAQIKILAVNAGIQAAKAGKYGAGFRVVAGELKALIQDTEESLRHSKDLLDEIRKGARGSSEAMQHSSKLLHDRFDEVGRAGDLVGGLVDGFVSTAERVGQITSNADKQRMQLDEVGAGLEQINHAAGELNRSAILLESSVGQIVESNDRLRHILDTDNE